MGSGLGLAIARELVEAHGGWIKLGESIQDDLGGAVFHVWIPIRNAGKPKSPSKLTRCSKFCPELNPCRVRGWLPRPRTGFSRLRLPDCLDPSTLVPGPVSRIPG